MTETTRGRASGLSVRLRLTLSYAAFLMVAGALLLAVVWVFLLRYVPANADDMLRPSFPDRFDLIRAFAPPAAWALVFLLAFGLLGGWILAGLMLAPLARITNATRRTASGSLGHRIDLEGRNDEFRELADSFDAMLARLEEHDAEQRRFAANASHELRTPLAITQTLLDVARADPSRDNDELLERLHVVNSRAIDLTEALLPLAEKHGVTIETTGDVTPAFGSRPLLLQLTTNLLHNAIVHNLPESGTVHVGTARESGLAVLTVESTGEPLSAQQVATLTEPFQRGAARLRTHHNGVGLGLAIVKSITQAHDGTLTLAPREGGGLRVTVHLPTAAVHAIGTSK
jgi:two-component system sensor histidine kinase VanS